MTPAEILTVLGLSSVAIGFAFKNIFENFCAGILTLWRFPFDPGDFIECGGLSGKVEDTTIRMTEIRQTDGELVVVPNPMLFKQAVHVLTDRKLRRITVICGVACDEDVDQSRDVIRDAVENCETVSESKPVEMDANRRVRWSASLTTPDSSSNYPGSPKTAGSCLPNDLQQLMTLPDWPQ